MAKRRSKDRTPFDFNVLSMDEARAALSTLGRTRRSKYSPIGDRFKELGRKEVLAFEAGKNEVQGVRNYMRRNFEGEHRVHSRHLGDDKFEVHVQQA